MPLPLTAGLVVLGVMLVIGVVAYLIDETTDRHEHSRKH